MARTNYLRSGNGAFLRANVEGIERLEARIAALPPAIRQAAAGAVHSAAAEIVAQMKARVEVLTGAAKASIHQEAGRHELSAAVVADVRAEDGSPYAAHLEYGHVAEDGKHVPAEPFFWPTWRAAKPWARRHIAQRIDAGIKQVAAGG